jgi:hypothetical protein
MLSRFIAFSADGKLSLIRYFVAHRSVEYGHFNSVNTDADCTIQWLIALMVLCCDPLAIALTAAASARRIHLVSARLQYEGDVR